MSSEANPEKGLVPPTDGIQHKSKLVRSASDNCNLAHSWAKGKSATETNSSAVQTLLTTRLLPSSISLQDIASGIFSYASSSSTTCGADKCVISDPSLTTIGPLSAPLCNPVSSTSNIMMYTFRLLFLKKRKQFLKRRQAHQRLYVQISQIRLWLERLMSLLVLVKS